MSRPQSLVTTFSVFFFHNLRPLSGSNGHGVVVVRFATDVVRIRNLSGLFGIAKQPKDILMAG